MTNAEKYLKDNVSVEEMKKDFFDYLISDGVYGCNSKNIVQKWEDFLNMKIKPTLTEDERVILKNIKQTRIKRFADGQLYTYTPYLDCAEEERDIGAFNHLFQFIKERRRIFY